MTSYDDRPNNDPWAPPAWSPPQPAQVRAPASTPGIETRQVLLILGASCLVAALAAGTALVWHALGPTGQAGLMLLVTATVLVLSVSLARLPATAQALGAVGVAGLLIDAVAGRSLELAGVRELPLHDYAGLVATAVAVALGAMAFAVPRLWAPPIGAGIAAMVATVAWMHPTTIDRTAWTGVVAALVAVLVDRMLAASGPNAIAGRVTSAALAIPVIGVASAASLVAATQHTAGAWAGVALGLVLLALPELSGLSGSDVAAASSGSAGVLTGALVIASTLEVDSDVRVALAGLAAAVGIAITALRLHGPAARVRRATIAASTTVTGVSYALLSHHVSAFAHLNMTYAVIAIAVAIAWRGHGEDAFTVCAVSAVSGVVFATAGVDFQLHLSGVTTPEAFVLVPALGMLALAASAMFVWPEMSSWVLAPGLVLGLLPTLVLALHGDGSREAVALAAGAALVVVGSQLRLAGPLAVGAAVMSLVVLRLVGPEMKRVPEWVALGVVGIILLALGATWEARMLDLRRAAHALRPRIAALR